MSKVQDSNTNSAGYSIYHDLTIKAPLSKVFKAISQPEELINWWPLKCSGKPSKGEIYNFYFAPEYDWFGEVIKFDFDTSFHIKMTDADADWNPTSFGFDLTETKGQVLLRFWHVNWPACNDHFRRSSFCWAILLKGLKDYIETGKVIPFEDRE